MTFAARTTGYSAPPFVPQTVVRTSGTGATETIPFGATNVVIEVLGWGGQGGLIVFDGVDNWGGGGGGSGGYGRSSYSCNGGQTLTYTVPTSLGNVTVSSGTLSVTTMTANSGSSGQDGTISGTAAGGNGGTVTGGNQVNTAGNAGSSGDNTSLGTGGASVSGLYGYSSGVGGDSNSYTVRGSGGAGSIVFRYT